jgi:hypothetical protein
VQHSRDRSSQSVRRKSLGIHAWRRMRSSSTVAFYFIRPDPECLQCDHERDIRRVMATGDGDTANARRIVARVEGEPASIAKDFEPGVVVDFGDHRDDWRFQYLRIICTNICALFAPKLTGDCYLARKMHRLGRISHKILIFYEIKFA